MLDLGSHIGRQERRTDVSDHGRVARLAATLDHGEPPWHPGVLPPLAHWLYFLPDALHSQLGPDGHPNRSRDGLLPDSAPPRRMWAGSRIEFLADIPLDVPIVRTSTLIAASPKTGRSGDMLFVKVRHEIAREGGPTAIVEEQDIVYRAAATASAPFERPATLPASPDPCARVIAADAAMLFRYSALTFNAHRIHYDRDYARQVEGYPDLVVQGPLVATLMLDHLLRLRPGGHMRLYSFRAASPLFVNEAIRLGASVDGDEAAPYAAGPAGVAMTGAATFAQ